MNSNSKSFNFLMKKKFSLSSDQSQKYLVRTKIQFPTPSVIKFRTNPIEYQSGDELHDPRQTFEIYLRP